jgi:predicted AlkP superfamily pyrophosphatase or phosphodiesterase
MRQTSRFLATWALPARRLPGAVRQAAVRLVLLLLPSAFLAGLALAGCAAMPDERRATFGIDFGLPPGPAAQKRAAIVFFVDGVNRIVLDRMLADGRMPNVKRYFVDRGLYADRCAVGVPSVTLPNETSLVTGVFPGRHGVTGITWFDRNRLITRNYEEINQKNALDGDYLTPTVFERLPDATTISLFFQAHRGATKFAENWTSAGPPFFFGWYGLVDRIALWRFDLAAQIAKAQGEFPALIIAYLLAPDMEGYRSGISSDAYSGALEHCDAQIGRILRDIEAAGRLDKTVIVWTSDHGMADVKRHWHIERFLRNEVKLAVSGEGCAEDFAFEDRLKYYGRFSCVTTGSGDRYWSISLRKPLPAADDKPAASAFAPNWLARPSPEDLRAYPTRDGKRVDLIALLRNVEAVDLAAFKAGPDAVRLVTKKGVAEVSRAGPQARRFRMTTLEGDDPLGYAATVPAEMLDGSAHDQRAWLEATADSAYPDLVPQIMAYFDAERAGDIVVFAAPGWDFNNRNKGGHGGVRPEEMLTALLMAGPGVPHERRTEAVRAVDVMPTILELLGRPAPGDIDGRSLLRN